MTLGQIEPPLSLVVSEPLHRQMISEWGEPVRDQEGNPICGSPSQSGLQCNRVAGYGTPHLGYGICALHGGERRMIPLDVRDGYKALVKHQRLRELLTEEAANPNIDSLDGEIILLRAFIKLLAEKFGFEQVYHDGKPSFEPIEGFGAFVEQIMPVAKLLERLTDAIERKYTILGIAGAVIPRDTVRAYMNQVQLVLLKTLRNDCPMCHKTHGMKDQAIGALELLGSL